ncbi:MAG: DUF1566 domain-containing protein [Betaproteobacteria bacterium]|nr:DUF1566 domain-containing protein [Betaproteobacteria bacterium]
MKSSKNEIVPLLGTAMGGGFYAGRVVIDGKPFALIVAPKAEGQLDPSIWIARYKAVPGARSYCDGLANTEAMAAAGSELAKRARGLSIGGHADWYLPSQDELEICYRNLKPSTGKNSCWARSGINLNSLPQGAPYTPDSPVQTLAEAFREGGPEAFDLDAYWSSTQHVSVSDSAWLQNFRNGNQDNWYTSNELPARVVRRLPL